MTVFAGQRGGALNADVVVGDEKRRQRVGGQCRPAGIRVGLVLPGTVAQQARSAAQISRGKPITRRHGLAAVAGPAGHAGTPHMRLPVGVDLPRHLQHAPGHHLGVLFVRLQLVGVVAVVAAFHRGHPGGQRLHQARKLPRADVVQHLHVLEHFVDGGRVCVGGFLGFGDRVEVGRRGHLARLVELGRVETAVTMLNGIGAFAAGQQYQQAQAGRTQPAMAAMP